MSSCSAACREKRIDTVWRQKSYRWAERRLKNEITVKSLGISRVAVSWSQTTCQLVQGKKRFWELLKESTNWESWLAQELMGLSQCPRVFSVVFEARAQGRNSWWPVTWPGHRVPLHPSLALDSHVKVFRTFALFFYLIAFSMIVPLLSFLSYEHGKENCYGADLAFFLPFLWSFCRFTAVLK